MYLAIESGSRNLFQICHNRGFESATFIQKLTFDGQSKIIDDHNHNITLIIMFARLQGCLEINDIDDNLLPLLKYNKNNISVLIITRN